MAYRDRDAPADDEPSLLLAASGSTVLALDRATGETIWENKALLVDGAAVIVWRFGVIITADREVVCRVDYRTGELLWRVMSSRAGMPVWIAIESDLVLVAKEALLDAFDHDGRKRWTRQTAGQVWFPSNPWYWGS